MNQLIESRLDRWRVGGDAQAFWTLQVLGWVGLSVISYFSLNVWYNQPDISYISHNVLQSLLGGLLSWPMRYIYRGVWDWPLLQRGVLVIATVFVFSGIWAFLRLLLFQMLTEEKDLWSDFGGWLFASIFIFLCWTALYHGIKYYRLAERKDAALLAMASARNAEATKAARAEAMAREAQLEMLRYQLNPHFLFNTLNAIQSLVTSRQTEHATRMIAGLSDFLRYSLYGNPGGDVTVAEELEALRRYLEIEQARFADRLKIEVHMDSVARQERIPGMLLQPLVENAIKYAIAPSEDGGFIRIDAFCDRTHLHLEVEDSGPGIDGELSPEREGVGLSNVRQRLQNHYGAEHQFELRSRPAGGLRAAIRVPLNAWAATA